ncbi:uncharacterized protein C8Q71DRAFT_831932 [Rhodofomes roseus]|uniref:DUF6533 domain-containing protein n=1 Tax=Rhodofomes roseus TaxID=34475 RepID=A0ABQ8KMZ8_9APHY|nr:uncharacterized protein C8Q71DRAFT_831932 [Rhodofomes roseus]KAH9839443.1 hypothetical protein C8Q71DRAFT_831932 [Rhodofomes roseus]
MDVLVFRDVYATRYLQGTHILAFAEGWSCLTRLGLVAIGLTALFYDHTLTFADEVRLVWLAPRSLAKYAFLFNRYLVLATLIGVACEMCGFIGDVFTDLHRCKYFLFVVSMIAVMSIGITNMLVLLRVVILWDARPSVLKLMMVAYVASLIAQVITLILTLLHILPGMAWSPLAGMCISSKSSHIIVAVWASPMLFELFVLISTALNAVDRPTSARTPIARALCSDGILYFVGVTTLRALNVALAGASLSRPSFTLLGVFFVWAMTTTLINRSLLQFRVQRDHWEDDIVLVERSTSPNEGRRSNNNSLDINKSIEVTEDSVAEVDMMWASRLERSWRYR